MADEKSAVQIVRECYSSLTPLRAAVQLLPVVGGAIDTLMLGRMAEIQLDRLERFVGQLSLRLKQVEGSSADLQSEAFSDLISSTFQRAAQTRSEEKRARFAQIIANQVAEPREWGEAEMAVRLLGDLDDIHVDILKVALNPPIQKPGNVGRPLVTASSDLIGGVKAEDQPIRLPTVLPAYGPYALHLAASDLVARALLHDAGIGRLQIGAMQMLRATDLAKWFLSWVEAKS